MFLRFWKLSQGTGQFSYGAMLESIEQKLVYVHKDTKAKAISDKTQAEDFMEAQIGDYFYLTHGNRGIFALGQFTGPANIFSRMGEGWLDRQFRTIRLSVTTNKYAGIHKWWTPNDNSTFTRVPEEEHQLFEEVILKPFFNISLSDFGVYVK